MHSSSVHAELEFIDSVMGAAPPPDPDPQPDPDPDPMPDPGDDDGMGGGMHDGGGCNAGGGQAGWLVFALAGLVARRRR